MHKESLRLGSRSVTLAATMACAAVLAGTTAGATSAASAPPVEAGSYHGTATYYGEPASHGMIVSAHLGDIVLATAQVAVTPDGAAEYELQVPGDDPATPEVEGPAENDVFTFKVNGVTADQQEFFNSGEDRLIDLTVTKIDVCLSAYDDRNGVRHPVYAIT
ncbi:MAG: hypothetical protein ACK2UL_00070, partial [Anaerolineae bacterium]